jgi:hypothetical protein
MYSRRKIINPSGRDCEHLKQAIRNREGLTNKQREDAEKDFLLVEAALNGDQIILSLDERARGIYCELSKTITDIADIFWVNPSTEFSSLRQILQGSAPFKLEWKFDPTRGR